MGRDVMKTLSFSVEGVGDMRRHDNAFSTLYHVFYQSQNVVATFDLINSRPRLRGSNNLRAPILYSILYFCDYMFKAIKDPQFCIAIPLYHIFNYITTGTFTPCSMGPLLVPVVKRYFQMSWALSIITKKSSLLKKLHLRAFSCSLTISAFHLIESQHSMVFA